MKRAHIIGAGLAGLSAAVELTKSGYEATLYEAGPAAGGRCRSYFDRALDARIDNGNHLLLSGNQAAMAFLAEIGARDSMIGPGTACFPFMDLATGECWTVEPGPSRIPWWVLTRRIPGTRLSDYLALLRLRFARKGATVAEAIGGTALYRRLLEPLAVSALNTPAETALASLMWAVVEGSLLQGGAACVPLVPAIGLSESFVDPAIAWLSERGGTLLTSTRVTGLRIDAERVTALRLAAREVTIGHDDVTILAVPPWVAPDLVPGLVAPDSFEAIVNVHFRLTAQPDEAGFIGRAVYKAGFIGLVGGTAEWIFIKPGIVSVTISAANRLLDVPVDEIATRVWADVRQALDLSGDMPPVRVVREKRATFAATSASESRRPQPPLHVPHFAVAGDWTSTGLPATIEGAIRSGFRAARSVQTG